MSKSTRCTNGRWNARARSSISKVRLCVLPHALLGSVRFCRSGWPAFVGRWCESVCAVRSGGRGWRCRMLTECGCPGVADVRAAGMRQGTASATKVQWRLPRHWRAGSASLRASFSKVSLCVLPHALLGSVRLCRSGWRAFVGRWHECGCVCAEWRARVALSDADRVRVSWCCC